jgi:hypothetical protein
MAFDYTKTRQTAERLIARFGQSATLRQIANSGTEWAPTQAETDTTITAVDLNERVRDASGTLVGQTQRTLLVSTSAGVTPGKGDKVVIGGAEHEVSEVRPLSPGGVDVMFEVDLAT